MSGLSSLGWRHSLEFVLTWPDGGGAGADVDGPQAFLRCAYAAAADLGERDRARLERP